MTLDLAQLTAQLKEQLADLTQQRTEIRKELDAILLIQRASHRADLPPLEQEQIPSVLEQAPVVAETAPPEETPVQEEAAPIQETAAKETAPPIEAAPEEIVPEPVAAVAEDVVAEPVAAVAEEAVAVAEPVQSQASPESTAEVVERRTQLEETVMALELNDEVAVLELLKMFQRPLSPGKIAEELVAVHWNFQGLNPRAAVNAALQKMVDEGKVKQLNGGDYGLPI